MKAPARVLLVSIIISLVVVFIVLYRYDLLPKGTQQAAEVAQQASTSATKSPSKPSESESKEAKREESVVSGSASTVQLENGKKLYETATCILCHGATGKADTPTAQALKATNLVEAKFKHNKDNLLPVEYIVKVITEGIPGTGMASFKAQVPNESDRRDIAVYVHSLAGKK